MESNPYQSPTAIAEDLSPADIPDSISNKIRHAFVAGVIQGSLILLVGVVAGVVSKQWILSLPAMVTGGVYFGLAFGVRAKSRVAASILLLVSLWSVIAFFLPRSTPNVGGLIINILILYFYIGGVIGTFRFHSFRSAVLPAGTV